MWAQHRRRWQVTQRAAELSKSDLVTYMVVEMTSLQGIIGEIYAVKGGETPAVGQAIREQYLPRYTGDDVPASLGGLALALADKLDSLIGLFAVRAIPTGSADPFGLRRAALGVVNSLIATKTNFSVRAGLAAAAKLQPVPVSDEVLGETATFVEKRLEGVMSELGIPTTSWPPSWGHVATTRRPPCGRRMPSQHWWRSPAGATCSRPTHAVLALRAAWGSGWRSTPRRMSKASRASCRRPTKLPRRP